MAISASQKRPTVDRIDPGQQDQRAAKGKFHRGLFPAWQFDKNSDNRRDLVVSRLDRHWSHVRMKIGQFIFAALSLWRVRAAVQRVSIVENRSAGERALGHAEHLDDVAPPGPAHVRSLFRFPRDDTRCKEQEKAREEHGKEHEQVDVQLVLSEEDHPESCTTVRVRTGGIDGT